MLHKLIEIDARLSARLRVAEHPGWRRRLAALLAHSGDSWFWLVGLALVWWLGPPAWKSFALQLALSMLLGAGLVLAIKFIVRRKRPPGEWGAIYRRTDPHSFPSGHAARMALLTVLGFALGQPGFGLALLVWTPLVALARVALGVHYLSDVVVGLLLGLALGLGLAGALSVF